MHHINLAATFILTGGCPQTSLVHCLSSSKHCTALDKGKSSVMSLVICNSIKPPSHFHCLCSIMVELALIRAEGEDTYYSAKETQISDLQNISMLHAWVALESQIPASHTKFILCFKGGRRCHVSSQSLNNPWKLQLVSLCIIPDSKSLNWFNYILSSFSSMVLANVYHFLFKITELAQLRFLFIPKAQTPKCSKKAQQGCVHYFLAPSCFCSFHQSS